MSENGEPSQFLVESLRVSTRSLRNLFFLILALSFLVGYSLLQQPWWVIERVGWGIDTFERIERMHRNFRNEPALYAAALKIFEQLKSNAISLSDEFEKLRAEQRQGNDKLEEKLKALLKTEQIDYLEELLYESTWDEAASMIDHIHSNDSEQLSLEYLILFASYFYPEFWKGFLEGTVTLLNDVDKHTVGFSPRYDKHGVVTAALGASWDRNLDPWKLGPRAVILDANLGIDWNDRLFQLPSIKRFSRSSAVLAAYCHQYDIDHCSLSQIRNKLGENADENVLRNLEVPYIGKRIGNLQIVLTYPFIFFTLVSLLYLQFRRRKRLSGSMVGKQQYHDVLLLDAPTIFANIELFSRSDQARDERFAGKGLKFIAMLALIYGLGVVALCVFYIGQIVYFHVHLQQGAEEVETLLSALKFSVSLPFIELPWAELIAVLLWIICALASFVAGIWIIRLIWKELNVPKKIGEKSASQKPSQKVDN